MSYLSATSPKCTRAAGDIALVIEPEKKDLGGFTVRRVLPSADRAMVGPFIFFDHVGPAEFPPGEGIQVRPHPHIGLCTVTYLFEGEIVHRDSLGFVQPIRTAAVNLMTAGRGIVHSERSGEDLHRGSRLHGIQSWMALPIGEEECDPTFVHYPAADLQEIEVEGVTVRVILGRAFGCTSPVVCHSPMLYLELRFPEGSGLDVPSLYREQALYVVAGAVRIDERVYREGMMAVACPGRCLRLEAEQQTRVMVIGGEPVGKRHIWWNFVSSSKERVERAKADWRQGRFARVPGDDEFIPLPD